MVLSKLVPIILLALSCSMLVPTPPSPAKSKSFSVSFTRTNWREINPDSSDFAFTNDKSKSIIMINSTCKKYEHSSLQSLSSSILAGIQNLQINSTEKREYKGREAQTQNAVGELDGVKIHLNLLTFKRNRCTYDFVIISANSSGIPTKDLADFNSLINAVEYSP